MSETFLFVSQLNIMIYQCIYISGRIQSKEIYQFPYTYVLDSVISSMVYAHFIQTWGRMHFHYNAHLGQCSRLHRLYELLHPMQVQRRLASLCMSSETYKLFQCAHYPEDKRENWILVSFPEWKQLMGITCFYIRFLVWKYLMWPAKLRINNK